MTAVINFKTDQKIKTQAQKIAADLGLNLSDILNVYLRGFVKRKELFISLNQDESHPFDDLLAALAAARQDQKSGKIKSFKKFSAAIAYLAQI